MTRLTSKERDNLMDHIGAWKYQSKPIAIAEYRFMRTVEGIVSDHMAQLERLARDLLTIHTEVVMDTPEDRRLHDEAVATFKAAIDVVTR